MVRPDYYESFKCIGGECKRNCCKGGWQIEIDDDALNRFSKIGGEFGEKVRNAIDEENCFKHINGSCPLLSEDGWCEMVKNGHELCTICDEYPRFTEFWEDYAERGISVSCEAAADIILDNRKKVKLINDAEGECTHPIFAMLIKARNDIFDILQNRDYDIFKRIRLALDYGLKLQDRINNDDYSEFSYEPHDTVCTHTSLNDIVIVLKEDLEILTDEWRDKLEVLEKLVDAGNTVLVIEHNLDVVKTADHIIDLGPEGGDGGGEIVCTGTPEQVAKCKKSYTGQFLAPMLKK